MRKGIAEYVADLAGANEGERDASHPGARESN